MSGRAGWGAIAGAANALQSYFAERRAADDKAKLYQQEQDIMQKREEALAQIRANLQDRNAGNRSDRAMNRDEFKHSLTSGDVTGAFKDEETGSIYGRTKDGNVIPLNITSDDYQDYKKRVEAGKADQGDLAGAKTQAQIDRTNAQTTNLGSQTARRDATPISDPQGDKIRADYQKQINTRRAQTIRAVEQARKNGDPPPGAFDENQAAQDISSQLYSVYGADAVKKALGGGNNVPGSAPQPQASPRGSQNPQASSQSTPTPDAIVAAMQAAVKAGKDPQAVRTWGEGLFKKYGYDPQDTSFSNVQSGSSVGYQ